MYSMSILVVLAMPSLIVNRLASEVVIRLAGILEDNICYLSLQKYIAEIAYMFLRVEKKEKVSRYIQSRNSK